MIVFAPHLDDAVWSASNLLGPGVTVVTVCAGIPPQGTPATQFDTRAGFPTGDAAVRARRAEDEAAAAQLGYEPVHLDCLDAGYPGGPSIAVAVATVLKDADADEVIVGPLGLRHPDHVAVAMAVREEVRVRNLQAWSYEEQPYAYVWPADLAPALARMGLGEETITRPSRPEKAAAVAAYVSQVKGAHIDAILAPERYHRLNGTAGL